MTESAAFSDLSFMGNKGNVYNEILVFQAKNLIEKVIRRLDLNINYKMKSGLRNVELYTKSPIVSIFPDTKENQSINFIVTPLDSVQIQISNISWNASGNNLIIDEVYLLNLGDTLNTDFGPIITIPTLYYTENYYNQPIHVFRNSIEGTTLSFKSRLKVALAEKYSSIISLSITDESTTRAEDVLNTLIAIYNEDAINDKNQITVNTSDFINVRLFILVKELVSVYPKIRHFNSKHHL